MLLIQENLPPERQILSFHSPEFPPTLCLLFIMIRLIGKGENFQYWILSRVWNQKISGFMFQGKHVGMNSEDDQRYPLLSNFMLDITLPHSAAAAESVFLALTTSKSKGPTYLKLTLWMYWFGPKHCLIKWTAENGLHVRNFTSKCRRTAGMTKILIFEITFYCKK